MATAVPVAAVGVAIGVLMGQQPVAIVLLTVGGADVTALADEAGTQIEAVGVVVGAFLLVRRTGDFIRVGLALGAFGAHGEVAAASGDAEHPCPFVGDAVGTQLQLAFVALLRHAGGDLLVDHVDHAADGAATVEQGCRPLEDLDALGQ